MESPQARINDLTGHIREYIETQIAIVKLDAADATASAASSMVSWIAITILGLFTLVLISIGGAIGLGYILESYAAGFFIVAAFYLLVTIILYFNRHNWIRIPLVNVIIKNIYNND